MKCKTKRKDSQSVSYIQCKISKSKIQCKSNNGVILQCARHMQYKKQDLRLSHMYSKRFILKGKATCNVQKKEYLARCESRNWSKNKILSCVKHMQCRNSRKRMLQETSHMQCNGKIAQQGSYVKCKKAKARYIAVQTTSKVMQSISAQ